MAYLSRLQFLRKQYKQEDLPFKLKYYESFGGRLRRNTKESCKLVKTSKKSVAGVAEIIFEDGIMEGDKKKAICLNDYFQ